MQARTEHTDQTLVGLSFTDPFRASEFLTAANGLASRGQLVLLDAVIVTKDADGDTRVVETTDPTPGRSAMGGAVWASLFGLLLGGPVGWVAGAAVGAGVGAVTAKVVDIGVPDEWVEWFRAAVQPATTTVVLLVADLHREALVEETARFPGAELVYANLDPFTLSRIKEAVGQVEDPVGAEVAATDGAPVPADATFAPPTGVAADDPTR